jgi:DNA polymerase I-like protein with 3'-5' exonuclease and polymerase domains
VLDIVIEEKEKLEKEIKDIMENVLTWYEIKLKVDVWVGKSWKEAK